jgi:hypothetical protein
VVGSDFSKSVRASFVPSPHTSTLPCASRERVRASFSAARYAAASTAMPRSAAISRVISKGSP